MSDRESTRLLASQSNNSGIRGLNTQPNWDIFRVRSLVEGHFQRSESLINALPYSTDFRYGSDWLDYSSSQKSIHDKIFINVSADIRSETMQQNFYAQKREWELSQIRRELAVEKRLTRTLKVNIHAHLKASRTITGLLRIQDGWDGRGGLAPTPKAIAAGKDLLGDMLAIALGRSEKFPLPVDTAPVYHGGLQMEWRKGSTILEVEISPDGILSYFWERDNDVMEETEFEDNTSTKEIIDVLLREFA